jgi:hypothetical protein
MTSQFGLISIGIALAIFVALIAFLEIGWRLGVRAAAKRGEGARSGVGVVDSVVYSLLGLLVGFTFSGAAGRFDKRRELMVAEVNAIHTAWKRVDLLPVTAQEPLRGAFRRYVDALIASYDEEAGSREERQHRASVVAAQDEIWQRSWVSSFETSGEKARMLLLPTVNLMFDAVNAERLAQRLHPPMIIYAMLALSALAGALFAGFAMSKTPTRSWMHIVGVAATLAIASYAILELESPRLGLVRAESIDHALIELRETMK